MKNLKSLFLVLLFLSALVSKAQPTIYSATNVMSTGFTANWEPVGGATRILIDVDDNSDFSSLIVDNQTIATGGTAFVSIPLTGGTRYY